MSLNYNHANNITYIMYLKLFENFGHLVFFFHICIRKKN